MKYTRKRVGLTAVCLIIIAGISLGVPRYVNSATAAAPSEIATSGFIEATNVNVTPEMSGRIVSIAAKEGDRVEAGTTLIKLDDALMLAQKQQAEVNLNLAQMAVEQSTLSRDNAQKAWENARDVLLNIAELNLEEANSTFSKLTYPYTYSTYALDVPAAVAAINDAQRQLEQAQTWLKEGPGTENYAAAWDQFQKALTNLTDAQQRLLRGQGADAIIDHKNAPGDFWAIRTAQLEMDKAELGVENTAAAVGQAYTAYQQAENGIEIAQAQVKQVEAALNIINIQMAKLTVSSPVSGTISARNAEVGEIAQAGAPILTVTELDNVTLTAYVPESQIGLVKLGEKAQVSVDSYPGETFSGVVTYISPRAVFTPGNIQLKDEREKMVFAVKIDLANQDNKLKPGMPADATIITNSQS